MSTASWLVIIVLGTVAIPGLLHLFRQRRARDQLDFNIIDEAIHHLDTSDEPWTVHVEVRLAGSVDEARLAKAIVAAAVRHPMARAYQRRWRPWHTVYRWQVADALERDPLEVVCCASNDDVAAVRARFQSTCVPIDATPPFRVLLASSPDGDFVMLNFNHAASDGVGAIRFLRSIGLAYGNAADPAVDAALGVRDLTKSSAPTLSEWWQRQLFMNKMLRAAVESSPSRLAVHAGSDAPGFAFVLRRASRELTTKMAKAKTIGSDPARTRASSSLYAEFSRSA